MKLIVTYLLLFSMFSTGISNFLEAQAGKSHSLEHIAQEMGAHKSDHSQDSDSDHACITHCDHGRTFIISYLDMAPPELVYQYEENYKFNYFFSFREERLRPPLIRV